MERFHVTSSAILVSSKTMKWRPCWCSGSPVGVLKPFSFVKTFPFPKSLRSYWPLIEKALSYSYTLADVIY